MRAEPIASATFPVGEQTCTITYYPERYERIKQRVAQSMEVTKTDHDGFSVFAALLIEVLASWDVLDEKGQPLPITMRTLARLPIGFLFTLLAQIGGTGERA